MESGGAGVRANEEFVVGVMVSSLAANRQPDVTRPSVVSDVAASLMMVPGGNM